MEDQNAKNNDFMRYLGRLKRQVKLNSYWGSVFGLCCVLLVFISTLICRKHVDPSLPHPKRFHLCGEHHVGVIPYNLLVQEFNFTRVDANKMEPWDLMYGGYPHCGSTKLDWDMSTGLNAEMKFSELNKFQTYFPCMGARSSFSNKRTLCKLQKETDPTVPCFVLPEELESLQAAMDGKRLWLLKKTDSFKKMKFMFFEVFKLTKNKIHVF